MRLMRLGQPYHGYHPEDFFFRTRFRYDATELRAGASFAAFSLLDPQGTSAIARKVRDAHLLAPANGFGEPAIAAPLRKETNETIRSRTVS